MPKKMSLQKFVARGQAAQEAVDAVIDAVEGEAHTISSATAIPQDEQIIYVSPHKITLSPTQPRDRGRIAGPKFDELVASAKVGGIRQPLIVRPHPESDVLELVTGERRLLAAREAGLALVPVIERSLTDAQALEEQLIENLLRDDLDPIEEARGYQCLLEEDDPEGKPLYSQETLAQRLGKSQSHIAQRLGLLKLPESVQQQVVTATHAPTEEARPMSPAHARVLVPFSGYPWILEAIQARIKEKGLPPAKEFPEFVEGVIFGDWRDEQGQKLPMFARPLSEGSFFGSGRHLEFNPRAKSLPRNWSQIPEYTAQHPAAPGSGPCTDCPHIRVLRGGSFMDEEDKAKYCLLSTCWEGKQKAHRAAERPSEAHQAPEVKKAEAEKAAEYKEDPTRINLAALSRGSFEQLTRGKDCHIEGYNWKQIKPIFNVNLCRTNCPHKAADGGKAYRQGYKVEKGKVLELGAVCLNPVHFRQLQKQEATQQLEDWKQGTIARLKGLAKQATKGLDSEDLVGLVLSHLDNDLHHPDNNLGHILSWQATRVSMTEFFQAVFGIQDKGMQRKSLAARSRKELETYLKFALLCRKSAKIRD